MHVPVCACVCVSEEQHDLNNFDDFKLLYEQDFQAGSSHIDIVCNVCSFIQLIRLFKFC